MTTAFHPPRIVDFWTEVVDRADAALASGAMHSFECALEFVQDAGVEFVLRVATKFPQGENAAGRTAAAPRLPSDPFDDPERPLVVRDLTSTHRAMLNKFSVLREHLLIVTKRHEDQRELLNARDFEALAVCMADAEVLGFYNGGTEAGASQAHKHLQWVPEHGLDTLAAGLPAIAAGECVAHPAFDWRHAFVRLPATWPAGEAAGRMLAAAFGTACNQVGLPPDAEPMPPYNLLVTPDWLLLVPRRCEKWTDVSVNSLGFAGSLFARNAEQIERIRAAGPLTILAAVGLPPAA